MEWIAEYKDGSRLHQFEGHTEHLFKEINQDKLRLFGINDPMADTNLNVDLATGKIYTSTGCIDFPEAKFRNAVFRLVYFKRVRHTLGEGPSQEKVFIGWQASINGKNYKRIVSIKDDLISVICE
jgi:hypothetical protein